MNNTATPSSKIQSFTKIDRIFHLVAIPVFVLLTVLLIKSPEERHMPWPVIFIESLIWILFIWQLNRLMIIWLRKRFKQDKNLFPRLFYQLGLSLLIAVLANGGSIVMHSTIIEPEKSFYDCFIYTVEKLALTIMVYSLLENMIYEAFYLFIDLSQSQVAAEQYKKESLEAQFQNLKNQLNPHFLFNSFNTLSAVIEEDPKQAVEFVGELSRLYRYVLNSQKTDWVRLEEELEMIRSYLFLQQKRHEANLCVKWDIQDELSSWWLPPLALQVTVENAIKHNEISAERPLTIQIMTEDQNVVLVNTVQPKKHLETSNGIGLSNLKSRYRFLADRQVDVIQDADRFTVKLPLLQLIQS